MTNVQPITLNSVYVTTNYDTRHVAVAWAQTAVDEILYASEYLPDPLKAQVFEFKDKIAVIIEKCIVSAIEQDKISRS